MSTNHVPRYTNRMLRADLANIIRLHHHSLRELHINCMDKTENIKETTLGSLKDMATLRRFCVQIYLVAMQPEDSSPNGLIQVEISRLRMIRDGLPPGLEEPRLEIDEFFPWVEELMNHSLWGYSEDVLALINGLREIA